METFIGQIVQFPYNFTPAGWALCDGSTRSIIQDQALFSLLGTQFGGDGSSTFALPNLSPTHAAHGVDVRYFIALEGNYPMRP